ncbi:uncharacterized protein LOC129598956 [Paramacrobiotus metropolitanus]|uniref:uncharacterized protein LOC129598956 n=1 Tax=Paramacrobiotus metropolitanus TaxID=2943436 RepID=UPI002445C40D|nr:uncharacterized protein LOC129598956 [Paramacrobiotus metropolitanus]
MASQSPTQESTIARFDRWIRQSWNSLSLTPRRNSSNEDAPQTDDIALHEVGTTASCSASASPANHGSSIDDINCGQILGKNLQPVLYEITPEQFILGYLCDVDWDGRRVLVDFDCYDNPPLWLPAAQVQQHHAVHRWHLRHETVEAALRLESDQPYVFHPARIISPIDDSENPICVEVTPRDGDKPIRKFVHPLQLRVVWRYYYPRSPHADAFHYVRGCCRRLKNQTSPLDTGQNAEGVNLRRLLEVCNEIPWIKVVRIWLDTQCVHCVYTKNGSGVFNGTILKILVRRSRCHVVAKLRSFINTDAVRDCSLAKLPYELLKRIVLSIEDIHSVVSAQKVCKSWHDIIIGQDRSQHVAVNLINLLPDSSSGQEQNYNRTHLINILDTTMTATTVSLTLMDGAISLEFGMFIFAFLSIKVTCLPMIFLRNLECYYPVAQNFEQQRLEWANLRHLMQACRELHLQSVIVPNFFGSIAGSWIGSAESQLDVDVIVEKVVLHSTLSAADRMEHFLKALDASCPAFTASDWEDIDDAYRETLSCVEYPLRKQLLMIQLLNQAIMGQIEPPLSRLAAHAFLSFYHNETSSSSVPGSRHPSCPTSRKPSHAEEEFRQFCAALP